MHTYLYVDTLESVLDMALISQSFSLHHSHEISKLHAVWFYKKRCKISTSAVSYLDLEFQLVSFLSLPPNFNYRFLSYRQRNFYFSYFLKKGQILVHFMITEVL